MKKIRLLAPALAAMMVSGMAAGCRGRDGDGTVDTSTTTVISVLNYDCGYGREYLENTAKAFQEAVKDVEYEPGKKGVYIDISHQTTGSTGRELLTNLANLSYDVFFSNSEIKSNGLKNSGNVADITKYVKASSDDEESVSRFTEKTSIYDRMFSDFRIAHTATDGKMYDLPLFMGTYNFTYDAELVAKKGLYIAKGSTDEKLILTKNLSARSLGVDGIPDTEDDGLPETWAQFYLWLDEIVDAGCTPMHFWGPMMGWALANMWMDMETPETLKACWSFDGTVMSNLVDKINPDGSVTYLEPTAITTENGYLVQKQESRYRALQIAKRIADSTRGSKPWINEQKLTGTHKDAQGTFLTSKYDTKPIVLFAEGGYWEAEATSIFKGLESRKGGKMDRKLALLPIPKYSREDVGTDARRTKGVSTGLDMFLHKSIETKASRQAVIDFFMFFNRSENMAAQNQASSQPRPYEYGIEGVKDQMSYYDKSVYNLLHSDKTDVVYMGDNNAFTIANADKLNDYYWIFYSRYKDGSDEAIYTPTRAFLDNPSLTAERYFEGMYTQYASGEWARMLANVG